MDIEVEPLTAARWDDMEVVFNGRGTVARGCWCMCYRTSGQQPPLPAGSSWREINRRGLMASADAIWFGAKSMSDAAGFVEVARRKASRPVVRLALA